MSKESDKKKFTAIEIDELTSPCEFAMKYIPFLIEINLQFIGVGKSKSHDITIKYYNDLMQENKEEKEKYYVEIDIYFIKLAFKFLNNRFDIGHCFLFELPETDKCRKFYENFNNYQFLTLEEVEKLIIESKDVDLMGKADYFDEIDKPYKALVFYKKALEEALEKKVDEDKINAIRNNYAITLMKSIKDDKTHKERHEEALTQFRLIKQSNPNYFRAIFNLADCCEILEYKEEAIKNYQSLKNSSEWYSASFRLGRLHYEKKEFKEAKELLEISKSINPLLINDDFVKTIFEHYNNINEETDILLEEIKKIQI